MGLVLDSSVLIDAERKALPVSELLASIEEQHGFHRANTPERAQKRRNYLDAVFAAITAEPFTPDMARLAAKIDAEAKKKSVVIPLQTC